MFFRPLRHQPPADPSLHRHDREGVRDDVMQLAGDAYPLGADLVAGAVSFGGPFTLLLLGQSS